MIGVFLNLIHSTDVESFKNKHLGDFSLGKFLKVNIFLNNTCPSSITQKPQKLKSFSQTILKSEIVQFRIMGDCEVADTEAAVGLGCALESFAEVDEVKS